MSELPAFHLVIFDKPGPLSSCDFTNGCTFDACPQCYPTPLRLALKCAVDNLRVAAHLTMTFWPVTLGRNFASIGMAEASYLDGVYKGYDMRRQEERRMRDRNTPGRD